MELLPTVSVSGALLDAQVNFRALTIDWCTHSAYKTTVPNEVPCVSRTSFTLLTNRSLVSRRPSLDRGVNTSQSGVSRRLPVLFGESLGPVFFFNVRVFLDP